MRRSLFAVLALLSSSCATYNSPRPLAPGQHAVSATVGGPLVEVPNVGTMPIPNVTVEGRHGVLHHVDVNYGLHLLPLAFGVAGAHIGGTGQLFDQPAPVVPALSVGQRLFFFTNVIDARKPNPAAFALSQTDLVASWELFDQLVWVGGAGYVPIAQPHVHLSPFAGIELRPLDFLRVGAEVRWLDPTIDQELAVVEWVAPQNRGAVLVTAGVAFVFGGAP